MLHGATSHQTASDAASPAPPDATWDTDVWPDGLPQPRVLFCCRAAPSYYRSPLFSPHEVFAGPECTDTVIDGRVRALRTPVGEYDVTAIIDRLPPEQRPDLVVVKADATRGNFPRFLDRFAGPKVLVVGDTHHFHNPIGALVRYAGMEPFDLIVMDHTRHHGHFFLEAGFERVCWIAALDYALRVRIPAERFVYPLTFVGQLGPFHPYRRHVVDEVTRAGLPLLGMRAGQLAAADIYASSAITLNCSLNGDLNLRVFEAIGSGGFLMTDRLSPESGLDRLFTPGRHLVTYGTAEELVEAIRHYLDHPEEARAIRSAGQAHLLATQSPEVKLRQFYDALYDGRIDPVIALDDRRFRGLLGRETQRRRLEAYGAVQFLHLRSRSLTVLVDEADGLGLAATAPDLPRVRIAGHAEAGACPPAPPPASPPAISLPASLPAEPEAPAEIRDETVLALPWPESAAAVEGGLLARYTGDHLVAVGRSWRDHEAMVRLLADWSFTPTRPDGVLFRRGDPVAHAAACLRHGSAREETFAALDLRLGEDAQAVRRAAALAGEAGDAARQERYLRRAVALDRGDSAILCAVALWAESRGRYGEAFAAVAEAGRRQPPDRLVPVLDGLAAQAGPDDPVVAEYRAATRPPPVVAGWPRRRILVVTNLFPPQEFGGYGRKLWEFAAELKRRGHEIRVLAADVPEFAKPGTAGTVDLEPWVERSLELYGVWRDGRAHLLEDPARIAAVVQANDRRILDAARGFGAEVCLAGNVDLMTPNYLSQLPQSGIPVIHCVGNRHPGFAPQAAPRSPLYRIAPASEWVGRTLEDAGFAFPARTVVYPGARVDHFYRPFPPAFDRLRIVFASLFVDYKGPHVLVNALGLLHRQGVDFTCEFAGDTPDAGFLARVRDYCERLGFAGRIRYPGFLDRDGLARLFDRSNVLVFPSSFEEPFGISQVEAMAAGLTVVSSGTGGSREIVRDGVDGLLFKADDHADLAAKLASLSADPDRWARLSHTGQERALAFTVAHSVDRIEEAFTELLAAR